MEISFLLARGHLDDYEAVMWDLEHKYDEIKDKWDIVGPASISTTSFNVYILLTVKRKDETEGTIHTDLPAL